MANFSDSFKEKLPELQQTVINATNKAVSRPGGEDSYVAQVMEKLNAYPLIVPEEYDLSRCLRVLDGCIDAIYAYLLEGLHGPDETEYIRCHAVLTFEHAINLLWSDVIDPISGRILLAFSGLYVPLCYYTDHERSEKDFVDEWLDIHEALRKALLLDFNSHLVNRPTTDRARRIRADLATRARERQEREALEREAFQRNS